MLFLDLEQLVLADIDGEPAELRIRKDERPCTSFRGKYLIRPIGTTLKETVQERPS